MTITFSVPYFPSWPFFTGAALSSDVPAVLHVGIGGHAYLIDPINCQRNTIEMLREPRDSSDEPGEQSFTTLGVWRKHAFDWRSGSNQTFFDDAESIRSQFRESKGIDPWERNLIRLQPEAQLRRASVNSNLALLQAGDYLYLADGNDLLWTQDPEAASPSFSDADIEDADVPGTVYSITTDGRYVYAGLGANGLHRTALGATTSAQLSAYQARLVAYANGRLIAANANEIVEVAAAGTTSTIKTHDVTTFTWTAIEGAPNGIFLAGNAAGKGEIYFTQVNQATGALTVPVFVGAGLADGETVHSLKFYLGVLLIGTNLGFHVADIGTDGGLAIGALVEIGKVECFEPQGRYVWFGWSNYDDSSTGLGRMSLGRLTEPTVPAFASDLLAGTTASAVQGVTQSVATYEDRRYFTIAGDGLFGQGDELVESGTIASGWLRFGTFERKVAVSVDLRHNALHGTVDVVLNHETGSSETAGSSVDPLSLSPGAPFGLDQDPAESFEVVVTLNRDATDDTTGPEVRRWTLRAAAIPNRTEEIILAIVAREKLKGIQGEGREIAFNQLLEWQYLKTLEASRSIVVYQEGRNGYRVVVDRVQVKPGGWSQKIGWFEGHIVVRLLTIDPVEG